MSKRAVTMQEARRGLPKKLFEAIERQMGAQPGVWCLQQAGHKYELVCSGGCCRMSVPGTPRDADRAARDIGRRMSRHPLEEGDPRNRHRQTGAV